MIVMTRIGAIVLCCVACAVAVPAQTPASERVTLPGLPDPIPSLTLDELRERADAIVVATKSNATLGYLTGSAPAGLQLVTQFDLRVREVIKPHPRLGTTPLLRVIAGTGGEYLLGSTGRPIIVKLSPEASYIREDRPYVVPLRWTDDDQRFAILLGNHAVIDVSETRARVVGDPSALPVSIVRYRSVDLVAALRDARRTP